MNKKQLELRQHREFGLIISDYLEFIKYNFKGFFNIFIRYNGIFMLLFLGVSYMMVTGFMGLVRSQAAGSYNTSVEADFMLYFGGGMLLFFILFSVVALLNYSISSSYMVTYEKEKTTEIDAKKVWQLISSKLGDIIIFVLLLIVLYLVAFVAGVIINFIPIIGMFAYYLMMFTLSAWSGMSFMALLFDNKSAIEAFGEGFKLLSNNYWKCIGVNLVLGILIFVLLMAVYLVPGMISALYVFHTVETNANVWDSGWATVMFTFTFFVLMLASIFSHALQQFGNGMLYFTLHEEMYNLNIRSKIDQIGEDL
ncbi:MAG TPA: hypothetical protein VFD80_00365 [Flavobacteriaceae bacterium]|nr:hypothetical protein [Flavobacteriaceae bacterium]